jgi:hypothetical protein
LSLGLRSGSWWRGPLVAMTREPGADRAGPTAWRYGSGYWGEVDVVEPPDAYTDAYTRWEPVLGGHHDGRPRVFSHEGTVLPAPQVDLDPTRPHVCVAHVDGDAHGSAKLCWNGRLVLVVQAVEGVHVWFQRSRGWTMVPGPDGRLQAARLGYNEKWVGWVAAGGRLWSADLASVWDALD